MLQRGLDGDEASRDHNTHPRGHLEQEAVGLHTSNKVLHPPHAFQLFHLVHDVVPTRLVDADPRQHCGALEVDPHLRQAADGGFHRPVQFRVLEERGGQHVREPRMLLLLCVAYLAAYKFLPGLE